MKLSLKLITAITFLIVAAFAQVKKAQTKSVTLSKSESVKILAQALAWSAENSEKLPKVSTNGNFSDEYSTPGATALEILTKINLKLVMAAKVGIVETKHSANGVKCDKMADTVSCQYISYIEHENGGSLDSDSVTFQIRKNQYGESEVVPVEMDKGSAG